MSARATIPPHLFRNRSLVLSFCVSSSIFLGFTVHANYLPFYFQSAKGTSASGSGLRLLPYLLTVSATEVAVGAAVTMIGVYVPFLWTGTAMFTLGAGLLFTLKVDSTLAQSIGYQIIAGYGFGSSVQLCATAIRASVSDKDIPVASSLTVLAPVFGGTLAASAAQNIFRAELIDYLSRSPVSAETAAIVAAGASNGIKMVPQAQGYIVQEAFGYAVSRAFILPLVTGGLAFLCTLGIKWRNIKKPVKESSN